MCIQLPLISSACIQVKLAGGGRGDLLKWLSNISLLTPCRNCLFIPSLSGGMAEEKQDYQLSGETLPTVLLAAPTTALSGHAFPSVWWKMTATYTCRSLIVNSRYLANAKQSSTLTNSSFKRTRKSSAWIGNSSALPESRRKPSVAATNG